MRISDWSSDVCSSDLDCRPQGSAIVASLDMVADRSGAELLKGHTVWASRAAFPPCDPDEYYWVDLIGCQLWGERDHAPAIIGKVVDVVDNGAHALLPVAHAARAIGRAAGRERVGRFG